MRSQAQKHDFSIALEICITEMVIQLRSFPIVTNSIHASTKVRKVVLCPPSYDGWRPGECPQTRSLYLPPRQDATFHPSIEHGQSSSLVKGFLSYEVPALSPRWSLPVPTATRVASTSRSLSN